MNQPRVCNTKFTARVPLKGNFLFEKPVGFTVNGGLEAFMLAFISKSMRPLLQLSLLAAVFFSAQVVAAKDMTNRLGIGYKDQFATDLPGMAVQYYPGPDLGLSGVLAIDTQKDNSRFGMMARLHKIIFHEDNLHFYMGAGAGMLSVETAGNNQSGFELQGFGGAEFFLPGLENLGFSFEAGVGVTSLSSSVRFRTIGQSPIKAGIIFYF